METTFERFINTCKTIPQRGKTEFCPSKYMQDQLNQIEFSTAINHERLVADAYTDLLITSQTHDPRGLYHVIKNYIRYYTVAMDIMAVQANFLAQEKGKQLLVPNRLARIFYQKKMTRAVKRVSVAEGVYAQYVEPQHDEDHEFQTAVVIRLNAFIFLTADDDKYQLIFTGSVRGLRYNPLRSVYETEKNIETLF